MNKNSENNQTVSALAVFDWNSSEVKRIHLHRHSHRYTEFDEENKTTKKITTKQTPPLTNGMPGKCTNYTNTFKNGSNKNVKQPNKKMDKKSDALIQKTRCLCDEENERKKK